MGIPIDPPYPTGKWIVIGGVIKNPDPYFLLWPEPKNGLYYLPLISPGNWYYTDADVSVAIQLGGGWWNVWASVPYGGGWIDFFLGTIDPNGNWNAENEKPIDAAYYSGFCAICQSLIATLNPMSSLCSVANYFGLPTDSKTRAEIFTVDERYAVMRFARKEDHTCIKIKIDRDYLPP